MAVQILCEKGGHFYVMCHVSKDSQYYMYNVLECMEYVFLPYYRPAGYKDNKNGSPL